MAFPTGWTRKCALVIQHGQVPSNQTAFPVLITEACLPSEMLTLGGGNAAQADGGDIRFSSDSAGASQLPCEVVGWTQNATPALAKAELHVPVSISSSADATIYVWYNAGGGLTQPAANSAYGSQAVWDANYKGVWHYPNGSTLSLADSTSNGITLTNNGGATAVAGKIGGGITGGAGASATGLTAPSGDYTWSAWFKKTGNAAYTMIVYSAPSGKQHGLRFGASGDKVESIVGYNNSGWTPLVSPTTYNDNNWHYAVAHRSGTQCNLYIDGGLLANTTSSVSIADFTTLDVNTSGIAGVDEARISNIGRSPTWILAEYRNQNSPSTFVIAGSPVSVGASATTLTPSAISTLMSFGTALAKGTVSLYPVSAASLAGFGTGVVVSLVADFHVGEFGETLFGEGAGGTISPFVIPSAASFGSATLHGAVTVALASMASAGIVGVPTIKNCWVMLVPPVSSREAWGAVVLAPGLAHIAPSAISSGQFFPQQSVRCVMTVLPAPIGSRQSFSVPVTSVLRVGPASGRMLVADQPVGRFILMEMATGRFWIADTPTGRIWVANTR